MTIKTLQEILAPSRSRHGHVSLVVTDRAEQLERRLEIFTHLAHRGQVPASVAVVGGAPHRHHVLLLKMVLVALVNQLVRSGNQRQIVDMAELFGNFVSKQPAYSRQSDLMSCSSPDRRFLTSSSRTDSPGLHVLRIRPHQVTEGTFMRNLLRPCYDAYLVQCPNFRTQSSMHTQNLSVDDGA